MGCGARGGAGQRDGTADDLQRDIAGRDPASLGVADLGHDAVRANAVAAQHVALEADLEDQQAVAAGQSDAKKTAAAVRQMTGETK